MQQPLLQLARSRRQPPQPAITTAAAAAVDGDDGRRHVGYGGCGGWRLQ
jgi:hypothetical protein